jgi:hypothetical protein
MEVEALLKRLGESDCQFNRNGSWYSAVEAKKHLSSKLNYAIEKKLANSAEQFIEVAASKSSMSGTIYLVKCKSDPALPSATWLNNALKELRLKSAVVSISK